MTFKIVRNDITQMCVDVIVNAANSSLLQGGGVCGAIFNAAGAEILQATCDQLGHCEPGQAVITSGYALPAKFIIHTVGPVWHGGTHGEAKILENCYLNSLELAKSREFNSIAFPLISSGIYGYPKDEALTIAITTIGSFLLKNDMNVTLVVYDKNAFVLSERLFSSIEKYIDDNYVIDHVDSRSNRRSDSYSSQLNELILTDSLNEDSRLSPTSAKAKRKIEEVIFHLDDSFSEHLFRLIDEKGLKDTDVYRKANLDRRLFSKIRSDIDYRPSKSTAIALAISLELNLDETLDLLRKAGYTLSHSNKSDVIIEFFIESGKPDLFKINEVLFKYDQPLLGA